MATLKYWIWLTSRKGGVEQPQQLCRVLEHFGTPEAAYFADPLEYQRLPNLSERLRRELEDKSLDGAERILERCTRLNVRVLTMQDADYPERLRQLYDGPLVLYIRGKWLPLDELVTIGMVGSRTASEYGKITAGRVAMELTRAGALVVSGIAQGIDACSIRGALQAGGTPVSVLGGGVDVPYPFENRFLYEDVAAVGALISEYPPGTRHFGSHFPVRNRIISGLSLGVCVVEGGEHSGSMITARLALEQNRDVFAVPGNADAPMSQGTNALIQQGEAKLVMGAEDILCEYRDRYPMLLPWKPPLKEEETAERLEVLRQAPAPQPAEPVQPMEERPSLTAAQAREKLTDDQIAVLAALNGGVTLLADQLIEETGLPARRVLSALTILQVDGYVTEEAGKRFSSHTDLR